MELQQLFDQTKAFQAGQDAKLSAIKEQTAAVQRQVDAIDIKMQAAGTGAPCGASGGPDIAQTLFESPEFKAFAATGRGAVSLSLPNFQLQRKTAITEAALGAYSSGVVMPERLPGIVPAAMPTFRVRDFLRKIPTAAGYIDFIQTTRYTKASPQGGEGVAKVEATFIFESVSEKVACLAHEVPISKQALQDVSALKEAIDVHLLAGLADEEDRQILWGDGTTDVLHGLTHQAQAWDLTLLTASDGYEYVDMVAGACAQLAADKYHATGVVLNPLDFWKIMRAKDSTGRYIFGDPRGMTISTLFGVPVAVTSAMTQGSFLVGDFQRGAALHVRQDAIITVGLIDKQFTQNMVTLLCEERAALCVYNSPAAFVYGQMTQSPA